MVTSSRPSLVPVPSAAPHASNLRPVAKAAPRETAESAAHARFIRARHKLGLSQMTAARVLGVSERALADWERGAARLPAWALVELERRAA